MNERQYEYPDTLKFSVADMAKAEYELDFDQRYQVTSTYNVGELPTGEAIEAFGKFASAINGFVRVRDGVLEVIHTRHLSERTKATLELLRTAPQYAVLRDTRAQEQGIAMREVTLSGTALDNED